MTFITLLIHEWKKGFRSQGFYKNLAVNLLLGVFVLYLAVVLLFVGFSLDTILEKVDSSLSPLQVYNGGLFYVMISGLLLRFFMQPLSSFDLVPYQILPIKRSSIINFLLIKPLLSVVNYFALFIIIPFSYQSVTKYYGMGVGIRFVVCYVLVIWFNSLITNYLKRQFGGGFWSVVSLVVVLGGIIAMEYFHFFSLFSVSMRTFDFIVFSKLGLLIPALAVVCAYSLNRWFFWQNHYPERFNITQNKNKVYNASLTFLSQFGTLGELIGVEIKLLFRHKRSRSLLSMSIVFLLYGLIFYTNDIYTNNYTILFFVALFETGLLMYTCGQWVISWDSSFFDGLMTSHITISTYIRANYILLIGFNVLCFLITTPYFYFGNEITLMHIVAFIYNTGMNVFLLILLATFNARKIDLSRSNTMNYQGTSFKGFLIMIPMMFIPLMVMWVTSTFATYQLGLWILGSLGVVGFFSQNILMKLLVSVFNKRKYVLADGFREREI
jgi:Family of unknown function (DUF5687)